MINHVIELRLFRIWAYELICPQNSAFPAIKLHIQSVKLHVDDLNIFLQFPLPLISNIPHFQLFELYLSSNQLPISSFSRIQLSFEVVCNWSQTFSLSQLSLLPTPFPSPSQLSDLELRFGLCLFAQLVSAAARRRWHSPSLSSLAASLFQISPKPRGCPLPLIRFDGLFAQLIDTHHFYREGTT